MKYTLEKVDENGKLTPVRESETKRGGSAYVEYETTSKNQANRNAHFVKNHMRSDYVGITVFEEDE